MNSFEDWVVNDLTLVKFHKNFQPVSVDYGECASIHTATTMCAV